MIKKLSCPKMDNVLFCLVEKLIKHSIRFYRTVVSNFTVFFFICIGFI